MVKTTVEAQSGADCPSGAQSDSLSLLVMRCDSLGSNWHNVSLSGRTSTHLPVTEEEEPRLRIVLKPCLRPRGHDKTLTIESVWQKVPETGNFLFLMPFSFFFLVFFAYRLAG